MFLYYVDADLNRFGDDEVDQFGLRQVIDCATMGKTRCGPDGSVGVLVCDRSFGVTPRYMPDHQVWTPRRDDGVWIGHARHRPPQMAELARLRQLPGAVVTMADDQRISIPHARRWSEHDGRLLWSVALPQSLRRDDCGDWVPGDVVASYRRLWDLVSEFLDARETAIREADVDEGESVYFQFGAIDELAIGAIGANYRVGADEIEILGVYDQRVRNEILDVVTDEPTRLDWVKKKLEALIAAGGNSSAGPEPSTTESTPDTAPLSPTCGHGAKGCTDESPEREPVTSGGGPIAIEG